MRILALTSNCSGQTYKTIDKGWAVRSWDYIPSGAPVCEYIGVLRKTEDLENTTGNEYIFEIDCLQTINGIGVREVRPPLLNNLLSSLFKKFKIVQASYFICFK